MAIGRKLTLNRNERFFASYGYGGRTSDMEEDGVELGENDVWCLVDDIVNGGRDHHSITSDRGSVDVPVRSTTRSRRRASLVPPPGSRGGLSVAFDDPPGMRVLPSTRIVHKLRYGGEGLESPGRRHVATSAPVNVPDWSKIYRVHSVESLHDSDNAADAQDSDFVPPHEYLARSHQCAAKSVFEGVGRTLKGRDMSRVRDAVWSQTGFNG